jgi:hypothetical protein
MTLGELIETLRALPADLTLSPGFDHPHSYRGNYFDLAFIERESTTVAESLAACLKAYGTTYQGWKGGDFTMGEYSDVYLVPDVGRTGEPITKLGMKWVTREAQG